MQEQSRSGRDEADSCLKIATFLPVRRWRYVLPFLRMTVRVRRQLAGSSGILAYSLKANVLRRRFWTMSVWRDRASVKAFVSAEPHAAAVRAFVQWAGPGAAFVEWESQAMNISWREAMERLRSPTFSYRPRQ